MDDEPTDLDAIGGGARADVRANRDLWDGWTELHVPSEFYDVEGFKRGRETLDAVELDGVLGALGAGGAAAGGVLGALEAAGAPRPAGAARPRPGLAGGVLGKSLLHLQCHFGLDTLSWARRGAVVTGVDFSEKAVAHAQRLACELALGARFVCADVTDTPVVTAALGGERFDIVFTSRGVISWLPDLRPWAQTIAATLRPGGVFFLSDSHPFCWMFDDDVTQPELRLRFDYRDAAALRYEEKGSYAAPDAAFRGVSYSWRHPLDEIVGALLEAGLTLTSLREYDYLFWRWFPWMVRDDEGRYRLPEGLPRIPLMFSLTATSPTTSSQGTP